jgi:hypothetical protein
MQDESGRSVENFDDSWKRRRDLHLTDPRLIANLRARIGRRICPEIKKAFQMRPTRIERDLVARYDAETGGHFGAHRDDTGISVAHRRFAVSINLNADFDGGEFVSRVLSANLQGSARNGHRFLRLDPAPGVAGHSRAPLCVPYLPVRRGGRASKASEFAGGARDATPAPTAGERIGERIYAPVPNHATLALGRGPPVAQSRSSTV